MKQFNTNKKIEKLIKFKKPSQHKYNFARKFIGETIESNQSTTIWAIKGQYQQYKVDMIFNWTQQIAAEKLYLWSNNHPKIIQDINLINFPNVKEINLGWNNIASIQLLHKMSFQNLTQFQLRDNKITQIKSFRCMQCPRLKSISLRGNLVKQLQSIKELKISELDLLNFNGNKIINSMKQFLMMQSPRIKNIAIKWNFLIQHGADAQLFASMLKRFNFKRIQRFPQHQYTYQEQ